MKHNLTEAAAFLGSILIAVWMFDAFLLGLLGGDMNQMIRGIPLDMLSPGAAARQVYKEGEGQSANPYPEGTAEHEQFMWAMARLQDAELRALNEEIRSGL